MGRRYFKTPSQAFTFKDGCLMPEKLITYCGQTAKVACDGKCEKAWGLNSRPRQKLSDVEDDYVFLADDELGEAPVDPGTSEGGDEKPLWVQLFPNRWCVRECERCSKSKPGEWHLPLELNSYETRVYNIDKPSEFIKQKRAEFRNNCSSNVNPMETRSLPNAVKQTTPTNCFQACVATVLGIDIALVPSCVDGSSWDWDAFQAWLKPFGLAAIEITFMQGGTLYPAFNVPCIVSGPSPRGDCLHAVVARFNGLDGFTLEHDPHSSDLWIDGEPTHCTVFVLLDPLAWVKRKLHEEKGWSDK